MASGIKQIDYSFYFPLEDEERRSGDIFEIILLGSGYSFSILELPPLRILNQYFRDGGGGHAGGHLLRWEPFELSCAEFKDLVLYLNSPEAKLRIDEYALGQAASKRDQLETAYIAQVLDPPEDVQTLDDYSTWWLKRRHPDKADRVSPKWPAHVKTEEDFWKWINSLKPY